MKKINANTIKKNFELQWHKSQDIPQWLWIMILMITVISIPMLMYGKYFFTGQALGDADYVQYFSSKKMWMNSLLNGEYVMWNPYLAAGVPQNLVAGRYPISTVLSIFPLEICCNLYYIVHWCIGSVFFYLYLKESGCSRQVSYIFMIIYETSIQINGLRKGHPTILAAVCLLPVVFYLIRKYENTSKNVWIYLNALFVGFIYTRNLQIVAYLLPIVCTYYVIVLIEKKKNFFEIILLAIKWLLIFCGTIAYSFIPYVKIISNYSEFGFSQTSYDTFASYSMSPIKLIQMIVPEFFGNHIQAFGPMYSSENDIEIYIGIFVLILAIYIVIKKISDRRVWLELLCALMALVYACIAHIPVISGIVYRIPIFGGFRCSARILFLFIFFMLSLSAKGVNCIVESDNYEGELQVILKISAIVSAIVIVAGIAMRCFDLNGLYPGEVFDITLGEACKRLVKPLFLCITIMVVSLLVKRNKKALILSILGITMFEILPYSLETNPSLYNQMSMSNNQVDLIGDKDYKVWDDTTAIDGGRIGIISQNRNALSEISSINAYIACNHPLLVKYLKNFGRDNQATPFNFTGLLTGSVESKALLAWQNDMLSMLGVRYIIDTEGFIKELNGNVIELGESEPLLCEDNIMASRVSDTIISGTIVADIERDSVYSISFSIPQEQLDKLNWIHCDLYGGANYDYADQEKELSLLEDNSFELQLSSTNVPDDVNRIDMRILCDGDLDQINIQNISIKKNNIEYIPAYKLIGNEGVDIYENENAKPLLYSVDDVEVVDEFDDIYNIDAFYNLDDVAYLVDSTDVEVSEVDNLSIIDRKCNVISAEITNESKTFLCYSQMYNPNWKLYVDGQEEPIKLVNGAIMGAYIPMGTHSVEFRYFDYNYIVGGVITFITVVIVTLICITYMKKDANKVKYDFF